MKINILLVLCIPFMSLASFASSLDSIQELLPVDSPKYIGYRLAITEITLEPKKNNTQFKINCTIINTGRKDLLFGKTIAPPPQLVINFDESLYSNHLSNQVNKIREALNKSDFHIKAGAISKKQSFILNAPKPASIEESPVIAIVDDIEDPRWKSKASSDDTSEKLTAKSPPVDDFESSLHVSKRAQFDENACSDLIFESIQIIKESKRKVTLEYTIINQGQGPAYLIKNRNQENKNMALQAYMSSGDKLTKSSVSFDGDFIGKGLEDSNGKLYPGERYTNTIKLNIQKMTKFTPYIILELDPYLSIYECDKKNNKLGVKVKEGVER